MAHHPHRHHYRLIILTLFLGLGVIVISLIFYYQRAGMFASPHAASSQTVTDTQSGRGSLIPVNKTVTSAHTPTGIRFTVQPPHGQGVYLIGTPISLSIELESQDYPVLGYDIIFDRDMGLYDVVSVTSNLSDYALLKFIKNDRVTVTGVFKPGTTQPRVFAGEKIATMVIKPKRTGTIDMTILTSKGPETTKIMVRGEDRSLMRVPIDAEETLSIDIE